MTPRSTGLSVIKGQENIINTLIRELRKYEMNLVPSQQPMTMLFIEPSDVGKTETTNNPISKALYREILKSKYADMKTSIAASKPEIRLPDAIPDDELDRIVDRTYVAEFGARPAGKAVRILSTIRSCERTH